MARYEAIWYSTDTHATRLLRRSCLSSRNDKHNTVHSEVLITFYPINYLTNYPFTLLPN